jgi:hypothetical protein
MNCSFAITRGKQDVTRTVVSICKSLMMIGVVGLAAAAPALAQNSELQQ